MHTENKSSNRIGIFSDIHGNLQALTAVLDEYDSLGITALVCCGDIVGYGANPNECVELIRSRGVRCVAGNHDFAALGRVDIRYFNPIAKSALEWTRKQLTPDNLEFLERQPMTFSVANAFIVHASPYNPEEWNYIITMSEARKNFQCFSQQACFIGHSHTPFIVEQNQRTDTRTCLAKEIVRMQPDCRYLFNVGSVGQPRDGINKACMVILDTDENSVEIRRVAYDIPAAQKAILAAGLRSELAERLMLGM